MPTNKHKRKASAHNKSKKLKNAQTPGLITSHPKIFIYVGLFFIALGAYFMAFEAQSNAMFGLAMLLLVSGAATSIYANFSVPKLRK
jgi:hypothetical protein